MLFGARSHDGLMTVALVVDPASTAARYLEDSEGKIAACVDEIAQLLKDADANRGYVNLKLHHRVMRYSFIRAEDHIWVKFYTNDSYRTLVPAVRIDRASELFRFFADDATRLEEVSVGRQHSAAPTRSSS